MDSATVALGFNAFNAASNASALATKLSVAVQSVSSKQIREDVQNLLNAVIEAQSALSEFQKQMIREAEKIAALEQANAELRSSLAVRDATVTPGTSTD